MAASNTDISFFIRDFSFPLFPVFYLIMEKKKIESALQKYICKASYVQ